MKPPSAAAPATPAEQEPPQDKPPALQDKAPALQDRDPALQDKAPALQDKAPARRDKRAPLQDRKPVASPATKEPRGPLLELGIGAGWLVGLSAVAQIVAALFRSNPLAIVVLQAVIVDLAAGRAGVRWDPEASEPEPAPRAKGNRAKADGAAHAVVDVDAQQARSREETRRAVRGVLIGASAALGVTFIAVAVSAVVGWAKVSAHTPGASLALGLVRAVAIGVRDALLYAGLPLYFVSRARGVPRMAAVIFGGLAAGAAVALHPAATPANVVLAVCVALAAAALWARDGVGWAAAGLAGGWAFFGGTVTRGGLLDIDWRSGSLAPGVVADGAPAWIAAACFLAFAAIALRRPAAS